MAQINAASRHRIRKGEGICVLVWSNVAGVMTGRWRVIYDDGTPDEFILNEFSIGSSRAAVLGTCFPHGALMNGVVVSQTIQGSSGGATQRGQEFVQSFIATSPAGAGAAQAIVDELSKGYVYTGHSLALDEYVEPGPASGHGIVLRKNLGNPAAGADFGVLPVPTGALWIVKGFFGQLVAAVAAANREFTIFFDDGTLNIGGGVAAEVVTSGVTADFLGGNPILTSGTSSALGTGAVQVGIPEIKLVGGSNINFKTYNLNVADDWGVGQLSIEEWVMPN